MGKAVFTTKISPVYDDLPEHRYHFPRIYLNQVEGTVRDWVVYYEPRRATGDLSSSGGRQAYFATARLNHVTPDPLRSDHFYAHVSDYLEFPRAVPFAEGGRYYESALRKVDGSTNKGAFGRAVRSITDAEYDLIFAAGFAVVIEQAEAERPHEAQLLENAGGRGLADLNQTFYEAEGESVRPRPIVQQHVSRPFRERAFACVVKSVYNDTCAITRLRIINGGGRSEVQAAHIRPVAADGPDSVRNGLALSGTMHWMFDRGLMSVEDDFRLLIARDRVPDTVSRILPDDGKLWVPEKKALRPHPQFLNYHRKEIFKG